MKFRVFALLTSISVFAVLLFGTGFYIQKQIIEPYGIEHDYSMLELPFAFAADDALRFSIDQAMSDDDDEDDYYNDLFDDLFGDLELPVKHPEPIEIETTPDIEPVTDTEPEPDTIPSEPETTDPVTTDPVTIEPETTEPSIEPETTEPVTTEPITTEPVTEPVTTKPVTTEPVTTEPETSEPVTTAPETTTKPSEDPKTDTYPGYDFSVGAVDESWYDDVLFIGESRTVGLRDYARVGKADYFCAVGMSVFNYDTKVLSDKNFSNKTLEELLQSKTYGKIFINLGINECGYSASSIVAKYMQLLDMVKKYQPDADIIIQGVMAVTQKFSKSSKYPDSFLPSNISNLNKYLKAMAEKYEIYYIHVNDYFTDSDGWLYSELSGDGCHLKAVYDKEWMAWISFAVGEYY